MTCSLYPILTLIPSNSPNSFIEYTSALKEGIVAYEYVP